MNRCPNTTTPRQHLGRKRYRLARREMRCVREEGHEGPCAWEPAPLQVVPDARVAEIASDPLYAAPHEVAALAKEVAKARTPEQIAASDARYREMLRRRRAR